MIETDARTAIYDILAGIAPEADPATLAGDEDLREALDLDAMDSMNFVVALHDRTGIDIAEADYPRLRTLDGAIAYLAMIRRFKTRASAVGWLVGAAGLEPAAR